MELNTKGFKEPHLSILFTGEDSRNSSTSDSGSCQTVLDLGKNLNYLDSPNHELPLGEVTSENTASYFEIKESLVRTIDELNFETLELANTSVFEIQETTALDESMNFSSSIDPESEFPTGEETLYLTALDFDILETSSGDNSDHSLSGESENQVLSREDTVNCTALTFSSLESSEFLPGESLKTPR